MNWRVKAQFAERIRMVAAGVIANHPEDDRSSPVNESNDQGSCKEWGNFSMPIYFQARAFRIASFSKYSIFKEYRKSEKMQRHRPIKQLNLMNHESRDTEEKSDEGSSSPLPEKCTV